MLVPPMSRRAFHWLLGMDGRIMVPGMRDTVAHGAVRSVRR